MDALKLVAEPRRQEILQLVWSGELSVGELAERTGLSYGGMSQHLALLRNAGFVTVRRDGKHRLYRADVERVEAFWSDRLDRLAHLAEKVERKP